MTTYVLFVTLVMVGNNPITLNFADKESCYKTILEIANKEYDFLIKNPQWKPQEGFQKVSFCIKVENLK